MLFDIAWPELLLIGMIALVVIGPKDLPRAMRIAGFWLRKARTLSREFQSSVDQMIREAELEEMREDLKKASQIDLDHQIRSTVDPTGELIEHIKPPEIPDYFDAEPQQITGSEPAPEPTPEEVAALPAPSEAPLPEQPDLPFDRPVPAEPPMMPGAAADAKADKVPSEADFAPPKP